MPPTSCGYSGTIDMSVDRFKYSGKENLRGEGKINESSLLQQQAPMALNCAFPAAMDSDSSYSFSNYNHADQFQTGANNAAAGDSFGSNSTAMPRVVGWSNSSLFSRLGADDSSSFNDPMMALPEVESTKNYVSHALNSSFDSRLDASAISNNLAAAEPEGESVKSLRLQLQIRETQNESLESEIQKLRGSFNEALNFKQSEHKYDRQNSHAEKDPVEAPENAEQVFRRLSSSLRSKDDELAETKTALESILTALALDPTNSVTKYGRYDAEALAHKMVTRIETLTKENQEMAKMLAYGRAKEMQIQLQLAQMKNKELNKTITELKGPKDAKDANTE